MANRELGGELGSPGSAGSPLRSPSGDLRLPGSALSGQQEEARGSSRHDVR